MRSGPRRTSDELYERGLAAHHAALRLDPGAAVQSGAGRGHAFARALHFLHASGRALSGLLRPGARSDRGARAGQRRPDPVRLERSEAIVVERALHEGFFQRFGVPAAEAAATEPSPTCAHYTHYLLALAHNAPYEVAVAGLLPCFWIYWEVGKHLLRVARPDNPYQAWIDTYADEDFAAGVRKVIAIADDVAEAAAPTVRDGMVRAFVRASQLEWMFWDSAYRLERWPV
jgi:thiaminase/transcriptional activator TenA